MHALLGELPLKDLLLHRAGMEQPPDVHRSGLTLPVDAAHGLVVYCGIPVGVKQDQAACAGQVEAYALLVEEDEPRAALALKRSTSTCRCATGVVPSTRRAPHRIAETA